MLVVLLLAILGAVVVLIVFLWKKQKRLTKAKFDSDALVISIDNDVSSPAPGPDPLQSIPFLYKLKKSYPKQWKWAIWLRELILFGVSIYGGYITSTCIV